MNSNVRSSSAVARDSNTVIIPSNELRSIRGVKRRRIGSIDNDRPNSTRVYRTADASSSTDRRHQRHSTSTTEELESVDLTEVNDDHALAQTLAKQREDIIKAQSAAENNQGRTTLTATKCAICMDIPTDATTTACGHMFCHKCILDSLRYEEERIEATTGKSGRGKCPACRKLLSRRDKPGQRRDLIPLQFKLKTPS